MVNIGRWPLGTLSGSTGGNPGALPWSAQRYDTQLEGMMRWLAALRRGSRIPVGFMATNAMPLHSEGRQTTCPPGYTEYPQHVSMFNQVAHAAAARHGVSFLDTYAVTRDVLELSFDGAHYGDPASLGLALEVEHWLESALRGEGAP